MAVTRSQPLAQTSLDCERENTTEHTTQQAAERSATDPRADELSAFRRRAELTAVSASLPLGTPIEGHHRLPDWHGHADGHLDLHGPRTVRALSGFPHRLDLSKADSDAKKEKAYDFLREEVVIASYKGAP